MKNIPQKLYLQLGLDENEISPEDDFNELNIESISWCADKIFSTDIEYTLTPKISKFKSSMRFKKQNL